MKRYTFMPYEEPDVSFEEDLDGEWVQWEDAHAIELEREYYKARAKELEESRNEQADGLDLCLKERDALRAEVDRLKAEIHELHHDREEK